MACLELPVPVLPTLGLGLNIEPPTLPSFSGDLRLCCKILQFDIVPPPIPLPPLVFNAAVTVSLTAAIAAVQAYIDALPLDCPKE
jgi:hypothetical protein